MPDSLASGQMMYKMYKMTAPVVFYTYLDSDESGKVARSQPLPATPPITDPPRPDAAAGKVRWGPVTVEGHLYYDDVSEGAMEVTPDNLFLVLSDSRCLLVVHASGTRVYQSHYGDEGDSPWADPIWGGTPYEVRNREDGPEGWSIEIDDGCGLCRGCIGTRRDPGEWVSGLGSAAAERRVAEAMAELNEMHELAKRQAAKSEDYLRQIENERKMMEMKMEEGMLANLVILGAVRGAPKPTPKPK